MASERGWGYESRVATTHIRLDVTGMSCSSCVKHVTKALSRQAGVQAVDVQLDAARAEITAEDTVSADALISAVREAGYEAKVAS